MANPTCSSTTLVTDAASYTGAVLNPKQRKALLLYAMVLELNAIGGTDYTAALDSTLLSDAATLTLGMTDDQREAARISLALVNAEAAGATVPSSLQSKLEALGGLINADDRALDEALTLLTCRLGVHKAYPQ